MKLYEGIECARILMPTLPVVARIDGRSFHTFTRGMERPYDERLCDGMIATMRALMVETNACIGYTQSDEITLAWHATDLKSELWFGGRIHKMVSQLAAQATLHFYLYVQDKMPEYASRLPTFDARIWNVPNRTEGANAFLWRELDATKNSITMAANAVFSNRELHGKNGDEKQAMLFAKGVNWNDYAPKFKRGTYMQRRKVLRKFHSEEIESLPPNHEARKNPYLMVERAEFQVLPLDPLTTIQNTVDVIFEGAVPVSRIQQNSTAPTK